MNWTDIHFTNHKADNHDNLFIPIIFNGTILLLHYDDEITCSLKWRMRRFN